MDPIEDLQTAAVARLLADVGVLAIVAQTEDGPAVFAPRQPFADAYPRITIQSPDLTPRANTCVQIDEIFLTLHSWARGSDDMADGDLVAQRLAGAVRRALGPFLELSDHGVMTQMFLGSKAVGDPDDLVGHVVSTFRLTIQPTA